jgi:hypothetical protein
VKRHAKMAAVSFTLQWINNLVWKERRKEEKTKQKVTRRGGGEAESKPVEQSEMYMCHDTCNHGCY